MSEWRSIETAPKDGTPVDLWLSAGDRGWRIADCSWSDDSGWIDAEYQRTPKMLTVTHWMPIPEGPK